MPPITDQQVMESLQSAVTAMQNIAARFGEPGTPISAVQLPPGYDNLLEILVAAGQRRGGQVVWKKNAMVVGPGTTLTMVDMVPPNTVMAIVGQQRMYLDSPHSNVLLTHATDGNPLFSNLALIGDPITVQGAFHPPARSYVSDTIVNNSALTVTFIDEMQVIQIDATLWDTRILPAIQRVFNLNLEFGKSLIGR